MRFEFHELRHADLIVGAEYAALPSGDIAGEPIKELLAVGNAGGFRFRGAKTVPGATLVVLFSTGTAEGWPDAHDRARGQYVYYGDNREPRPSLDEALEATHPGGNRLLRQTFDELRRGNRHAIPPFFLFHSVRQGARDVRFVGLAAPGAPGLGEEEDLVAFWRTNPQGQRYINYRAVFTVLDVPRVERSWLTQIIEEGKWLDNCPEPWRRFVDGEGYTVLLAD